MVSDRVPFAPTFTFPKLRLAGFALSAPGATPVPETAIVTDGFGASDAMVTFPLALPLVFGAKVTVNVAVFDASIESGVEIPLIENAELLTDTCEIDTLDESPLVIVTTCDLVAPTFTLPNASVVGLIAMRPAPSPERATVCVPSEASLPTERVAVKAAAAFGVNETLRLVLCPAASESGSAGEDMAKYFVETEAELILTALFPVLVAVTVNDFVVLGVTLPKLRLAPPRTRFPICCPEPD